MTAVDEDTYAALISLTKREFAVGAKDPSRAQKAACIHFWRHSSKFKVRKVDGFDKFFFREKEVLKRILNYVALLKRSFNAPKERGQEK